jgi:hypothetical protein
MNGYLSSEANASYKAAWSATRSEETKSSQDNTCQHQLQEEQ